MALIEDFLKEVDANWKGVGGEPVRLQIIGSGALMLQTDFLRGTKDSDVLESAGVTAPVKSQLLALAGRNSPMSDRYRHYVDVVKLGLLFMPQRALFHPVESLKLRNFKVEVLDIVDVAVSKLARYKLEDANDIRAMADRGLLDHARFIKRFKAAADWFSMDARASDVPKYLERLRVVERDILAVPPADIELPAECE